jgi:hypothetical protein
MPTARYVNAVKKPKTKIHLLLTLNIEGNEFYFTDSKLSQKNVNVLNVLGSYFLGNATFTNASKTITGSGGTLFTENVFANDFITNTDNNDGLWHKISTVDNDTQLTLIDNFPEASATNANYKVANDFRILNFKSGFTLRSRISTRIDLKNMSSPLFKARCSINGEEGLQDLRANFTLTNGTAELALWIDGLSYQDRLVVGSGLIRNPQWGRSFELFNFDIIDSFFKKDRKFPPERIDFGNFPKSTNVGFAYPILYGNFFNSPAYDMGNFFTNRQNLLTADFGASLINKMDRLSNIVSDSFQPDTSGPERITFDGFNLISTRFNVARILKHSGFSSTILDSFTTSASLSTGLTWDGSNLIGASTTRIFKHSGTTSTVTSSFSKTDRTFFGGITWDGTDLIAHGLRTGVSGDVFFKFSGFTNTIKDSFDQPLSTRASNFINDITFDGDNILAVAPVSAAVQRFFVITNVINFADTIINSFSAVSDGISGIEIDASFRRLVAGHNIKQIDIGLKDVATTNINLIVNSAIDNRSNILTFMTSKENEFFNAAKIVSSGQGKVKPDGTAFTGAVESLKDIFVTFTGFTNAEIDSIAFDSTQTKLSQWKVGSIFNASGTGESFAFDTIQQRFTKQFPIVLVQREGLQSIQAIEFDDITPVIKLRRNKNIIRTIQDPSETNIDDVKNKFSVSYKFNSLTGQFDKFKFRDSTNNNLCKLSEDRFGFSEGNTVLALDIVDDSVADLFLDFQILKNAFVHILIAYECTLETSVVNEGEWVEVTDADYGFTDKLFMVVGKTYNKNLNSVILSLRENIVFEKPT